MRRATQSPDEVYATRATQTAACLLQLCCCSQGITAGVIYWDTNAIPLPDGSYH